jgi:PAS domain S-box-containing protein
VREHSQELLDRAGVGIAQIDPNGGYLSVNDRYCDLLGRCRDELLEAQLQEFVAPEDLPVTLDGFIRVLETGTPGIVEYRTVRRDGGVIWLGNSVSAARDDSGDPEYALVLAQDVTTRKEAEHALARSRADLRMIIDSAAEGIYCVDRNGRLILCNAAFLRTLGFAREQDILGKDVHELIHHSHADGEPFARSDCPVVKTVQSGIHSHTPEAIFFRHDKTTVPVECWVRPIVRGGEIEGAVCTFIDITERKHAEAQQQLLMREMAHRVKNTIAMVQAIVGQSLRKTAAAQPVLRSISQRLVALGNAHTVLTRTRWGNASIVEVVESAIDVHRSHSARIRPHGPNIEVGAKAALGLTMALHELCTNAAKYGALSNDAGVVSIEWAILGGAADARFRMRWQESDGPPVEPPTQRGFGSRLIVESVGGDLNGQAELEFHRAGVVWTLDVPLNAVVG